MNKNRIDLLNKTELGWTHKLINWGKSQSEGAVYLNFTPKTKTLWVLKVVNYVTTKKLSPI